MFAWIYALFFGPPTNRNIFNFHDGRTWRRADPMAIARRLAADSKLAANLQIGQQDDEFGRQAFDEALAAIRGAFGVKTFEEGGLAEEDTLALYVQFSRFVQHLKKTAPNWRSEPSSSPAASTSAASAMPSGVESSSTPIVSSTSAPSPSTSPSPPSPAT